ncbi:PREDICTED: atlastin-1-like [Acropora digitifera]|uniref:atlastin-1-like n=1 Tax=Acropora digitifera TaxID=70779 RepID=UPI00077A4FD9|nr:PREDICTED: atlastin-1-like [Acropora digitifera]
MEVDQPDGIRGTMAKSQEPDLDAKLLGARPISVVVATQNHTFELDEKALGEILLDESVRDKKVAVVSVAGAFRKGKSFLLDFFLRYLDREGTFADWVGGETEALEGFSWRGGSERDTTGILLWSKPYIKTLPNGEEVGNGVLSECRHLVTSFKSCHQALIFRPRTVQQKTQLAGHFSPYFVVYLFLPDINDEFKTQLRELIPSVLSADNLVVKSINGGEVTCRGLLEYFKAYMKIFQSEELPQPKSMLLATAEANNLAALATSKDAYTKRMEKLCGGDTPYLAPHELEKKHAEAKEASLAIFRGTRKMGGNEFSKEYLDRLEKEVNEAFVNFEKLNDGKNIFNAARTPAVFFTVVVLGYFFASVFASVGLLSFVRMFNLIIWTGLLAIVVWAYIRFSGEFRDLGAKLDHAAELIWDEVSLFYLFGCGL